MDALQAISEDACYPAGTARPSATGRPIAVGQGWPIARDIDEAIAAGRTLVSVYAVPGTTARADTPMDWNPGAVVPPLRGMAVTLTDDGFALSGTPTLGEYVTVSADGASVSIAAAAGDTVETMAAALAAALPGAAWSAEPGEARVAFAAVGRLDVRNGAPATMGRVTHRQRQNFQITVWAPTPSDRTVVARAIDGALKASLAVPMPDTSDAIVRAQGTNLDDRRQETSGYHRALVYTVEWDTLHEYPAWEITAPVVTVAASGRGPRGSTPVPERHPWRMNTPS